MERRLERTLHRASKLVDEQFAWRVKAELDGPGSKTQAMVAKEIGCSLRTVERAVASLKPRSSNPPTDGNRDLETPPDEPPRPPTLKGVETEPGIFDVEPELTLRRQKPETRVSP